MPDGAAAPRDGRWAPLLGLAVLIPVGTMIVLWRFDGLYGQDPFAYHAYATGPLRESLLRLSVPPPFFWPPGYPLATALASLAVGPTPLAGQIVSLVAGAAVPVFTALLARELFRGDGEGAVVVPLVAGLLAAFTGQLWQSSAVVMSDTTGLALATAGVWALARYGRVGAARWLYLAAALLAAATLTRWIYGIVAVPATVYALLAISRRDPARAMVDAGGAAIIALAILAPVVVPALVRLVAPADGVTPFAGNFHVYDWHPARAVAREFRTPDGTLRYSLPNGLYYALAPARWAYFTPMLAVLLLPGAWTAIRRRRDVVLLLILGWAAAVYIFHAGAAYQNFRFTLAYLPPLAILAAIGAERLFRIGGRLRTRALALYLAIGLTVMAAAGTHTLRVLVDRKNDSVAVAEWARSRIPADARLLTFGLTLTFRHYTPVETVELFEQDPERMSALLAADAPAFLLADTVDLVTQWRDLSPGLNFRWLRDVPGLTAVGHRGGHTLFRIGPVATPARSATWTR